VIMRVVAWSAGPVTFSSYLLSWTRRCGNQLSGPRDFRTSHHSSAVVCGRIHYAKLVTFWFLDRLWFKSSSDEAFLTKPFGISQGSLNSIPCDLGRSPRTARQRMTL
jgi:hypothetical protein